MAIDSWLLDQGRPPAERSAPCEGASGRARGSGIGLSLVRSIAEAHGGTASIESPAGPEGGTAFTITVPVVKRASSSRGSAGGSI
jgi:signal transduction histidine kinase